MSIKRKIILTVLTSFLALVIAFLYWSWSKQKAQGELVGYLKMKGAEIQYSEHEWAEKSPLNLKKIIEKLIGREVAVIDLSRSSISDNYSQDKIKKIREVFPNCMVFNKWDTDVQNKIQQSQEKSLLLVTAIWDLCSVMNKQAVQEITSFLIKNKIKCYCADNTYRNEHIQNLLKKHESPGVPLTVFYSQGKDYILPEIFTKKELKEFIEKALTNSQ